MPRTLSAEQEQKIRHAAGPRIGVSLLLRELDAERAAHQAIIQAAEKLAEALKQNHSGVLCDASACVTCAALAQYGVLKGK